MVWVGLGVRVVGVGLWVLLLLWWRWCMMLRQVVHVGLGREADVRF